MILLDCDDVTDASCEGTSNDAGAGTDFDNGVAFLKVRMANQNEGEARILQEMLREVIVAHGLFLEAFVEEHFDIFPTPSKVKSWWGVAIELKGWQAVDLFHSLIGDLGDFLEWGFLFVTGIECLAEPDIMGKIGPVGFIILVEGGESFFAVDFEVIVPDGGNGMAIVFPEFAFVTGAVGCDGRILRMLSLELAVEIEEIREAHLEKNVISFDIAIEIIFVLNDSILEGNAVRANNICIGDIVILGIFVANGQLFVPDFLGGGDRIVH